MSLNKTALEAGILALNNELYANASNLTPAQASARHASEMATLFYNFVKSGLVSVTVTTTGTPTFHTGSGTGAVT
jgi:hypothetical protein